MFIVGNSRIGGECRVREGLIGIFLVVFIRFIIGNEFNVNEIDGNERFGKL